MTSEGIEVRYKESKPREFKNKLLEAKATIDEDKAWRVDDTHSEEDYAQDDLYVVGDGSCVAVTPEGDIISVCKNANDSSVRGKHLIEMAVAKGGKKLDAFEGLFGFYTKLGFEPVSWTPFNREYAPHDWVSGRDKEEAVVFYRYTGMPSRWHSFDSFIHDVPPSEDYDKAEAKRNAELKG